MPYQRRRTDAAFATAWDEATNLGTKFLEWEAIRRAYHGTLRPVFYKGKQCGSICDYSDQLLMFLLRARNPKMYREKFQLDHSNDDKAIAPITIVRFRRLSDVVADSPTP